MSFIKTRPHLGNSMNDDVNGSCLIEMSIVCEMYECKCKTQRNHTRPAWSKTIYYRI